MEQLQREGVFRARTKFTALRSVKSGAIVVDVMFEVLGEWAEAQQVWTRTEAEGVKGSVWLTDDNRQVVPADLERLRDMTGWQGSIDDLEGFKPVDDRQVNILVRERNGFYNAAKISPPDAVPVFRSVPRTVAADLDRQLRALGQAPPPEPPPAPPATPAGTPPATVVQFEPRPFVAANPADDDIPF